MNTRLPHTAVSSLLLAMTLSLPVQAGWDDLLKQGEKLLQEQTSSSSTSTPFPAGVDTATLAKGLKEALQVGGKRAIEQLAANGGYANHADVRIPMPGMLESVEALEASMNSWAERAISEAKPIFMDTLENMTLDDARRIYSGGDTAATDYFREKTQVPLTTRLQPLIEQAMGNAGVVQAYQLLVSQAESQVPMLQGMSPNLGKHVTEAALDGFFLRLAQEEQKIRENPVARTTDLLKEVFGQ